jgi:hypothetical protein
VLGPATENIDLFIKQTGEAASNKQRYINMAGFGVMAYSFSSWKVHWNGKPFTISNNSIL